MSGGVVFVLLAGASARNAALLWDLVGADVGAAFVVAMYLRRLLAAKRGDKRLQRHFMWRLAPLYYSFGWLLVAVFAVALVRQAPPGLAAVAAFVCFTGLWAAAGILLWSDRRIESDTSREPTNV